jgi:hypothetical protein
LPWSIRIAKYPLPVCEKGSAPGPALCRSWRRRGCARARHLRRGEEVRRDQPDRPVAAHLQRQLPAQLDRLADHRGQQRHLGHQRLHLRRIVVLGEDLLQRAVQPRDAAPDVGTVKLERQDGVIPGDAGRQGHE